jgi:hypothetical protein
MVFFSDSVDPNVSKNLYKLCFLLETAQKTQNIEAFFKLEVRKSILRYLREHPFQESNTLQAVLKIFEELKAELNRPSSFTPSSRPLASISANSSALDEDREEFAAAGLTPVGNAAAVTEEDVLTEVSPTTTTTSYFTEHFDPSSRKNYHNAKTGQTLWEIPKVPSSHELERARAALKQTTVTPSANTAVEVGALPAEVVASSSPAAAKKPVVSGELNAGGWKVELNAQGRAYFTNLRTGESAWEIPEADPNAVEKILTSAELGTPEGNAASARSQLAAEEADPGGLTASGAFSSTAGSVPSANAFASQPEEGIGEGNAGASIDALNEVNARSHLAAEETSQVIKKETKVFQRLLQKNKPSEITENDFTYYEARCKVAAKAVFIDKAKTIEAIKPFVIYNDTSLKKLRQHVTDANFSKIISAVSKFEKDLLDYVNAPKEPLIALTLMLSFYRRVFCIDTRLLIG